MTPRKIGGALIGLSGVAVVLGPDLVTELDLADLAQMAVLGAALSYAVASVWARLTLKRQAPEMNALGMLTGSLVLMLPVAVWPDGTPSVSLSAHVWAALLTLSVLSTAGAYLLYFGILARAGAANLMLVTLLVPPVAVALGVAFLGERISPVALSGFGLIAAGLIVTDGRAASWLLRRRAG